MRYLLPCTGTMHPPLPEPRLKLRERTIVIRRGVAVAREGSMTEGLDHLLTRIDARAEPELIRFAA